MYQEIPEKDEQIGDVAETYHRDPEFMKVKSLLAWTIYFHINRLWFFNRILLSGETSHNQRPHFAGMIFLHMNTL